MPKVCLTALAIVLAGFFAIPAVSQQAAKTAPPSASTVPSIDQSLEWQNAYNPKISPDGKRLVYEVQKTNWEENAFERNLWIGDIATGETHALTTAKKSSTNPAWSPDGKWIAFLSDRPGQIAGTPDGKKQLYVISADGGEAQQLTKVENDVSDFDWAPDSKRLAFSMSDPETKSMKDRKEKHGEYSIVHGDYSMMHLWTIEFSSGNTAAVEPKRLTEGDKFSVGDFSWSPDGTRIAFSAQRDPDLISLDTADLYVVTVSDKTVKKIVSTPGPDRNPKWSPDGKRIAFESAAASRYFFYTN
jgi:Tol biopolymer transport system component